MHMPRLLRMKNAPETQTELLEESRYIALIHRGYITDTFISPGAYPKSPNSPRFSGTPHVGKNILCILLCIDKINLYYNAKKGQRLPTQVQRRPVCHRRRPRRSSSSSVFFVIRVRRRRCHRCHHRRMTTTSSSSSASPFFIIICVLRYPCSSSSLSSLSSSSSASSSPSSSSMLFIVGVSKKRPCKGCGSEHAWRLACPFGHVAGVSHRPFVIVLDGVGVVPVLACSLFDSLAFNVVPDW